jgi:hypothetical protein
MTATIPHSATRVLGVNIGASEPPDAQVFRLGKSFAAVHFEPAGRGRIVFLPEGAELRVVGYSCVSDCFEVVCENRNYHIFKVDLLGPWSSRIEPIRAVNAAGARA